MADRQRRPFADAVGGQDGRAARRRGEERGGGVRLVVLGEQDLRARHAEVRRDDAAHPDLLAERVLDRVRKRPPGARERRAARRSGCARTSACCARRRPPRRGRPARARRDPGTIRSAPSGNAASFLRRDSRSSCTAQTGHAVDRRAPPPSRGSARRCRGSSCQYWLVGELVALAARSASSRPARGARRVWRARRTAAARRST